MLDSFRTRLRDFRHRLPLIIRDLNTKRSYAMFLFAIRSKLFGISNSSCISVHEQSTHSQSLEQHKAPETSYREGSIPKIIFQTWKTKDNLPKNYSYWSSTFRTVNPEYQHLIWDDADNRNFIVNNFPWFLPFYDGYPREIFRADVIRFFFLFKHGGLYADMDTECLRPLKDTLKLGQIILGRMGNNPDFDHSIPNAMMASSPGQLFWLLAITMAIEKFREYDGPEGIPPTEPEKLTGPVLLKRAVDYYNNATEQEIRRRSTWVLEQIPADSELSCSKIHLLEPAVWYPVDWANHVHMMFRHELLAHHALLKPQKIRSLLPNSQLVTHWTHSW